MGDKLKVLHIIGGGEFGGAEQHILTLIEEFQKDPAIDAEVVTFYDAPFSNLLREKGLAVTPFKELGRFDIRVYPRLIEILQSVRPDIVHSHGVKANFFARLAGVRAKIPHRITTVHSFLEHDYPKRFPYFIASQMEKRTRFLCNHFVAVSQALYDDLIKKGVAPIKISIIPNGIPVDTYAPRAEWMAAGKKLRQAWNIPEDGFVIGTTARLVPVKGLSYLIKGFAKAVKEEPNLYLVIIGDGPQKNSLIQLSEDLSISKQVRFVGFRADVPASLAAIDGYINTSVSEGQSISLLEAMAAEKPAIVTEVGGMKEMVTDLQTAIVIPPRSSEEVGNSILVLKREEKLREQLRQAAKQEIIRHYSSTVMTQKLKELYYQMIEGTL